ncbi:MAG: hypothetical protein ACM3MG_08425 [Bacillota bacterium]
MKRFKLLFSLILSLGLTTSCDKSNVLTEYSQTNSDEALYIDAKNKMDNLQWQAAIDIIEQSMSSGYRARRDVQNSLAGAYAGKCGVTFFDLISGLKNSPSPQIFPYFMGIFAGVTLDTPSCDTAIQIMQGIGTVAQRTSDEDLYLALLGLTRIGTTLSAKFDQSPSNGTIDSNSTVCNNNASGAETDGWAAQFKASPFNFPSAPAAMTHYVTDTEVKKIIVGLGLIFENAAALTTALGGGSNSALDGINSAKTACASAIGAITNNAVTTCEFISEASVPSSLVYAFRLMLRSDDFGFGGCSISTNLTYFTNLAQYISDTNANGGVPPDYNNDGVPDNAPTMPATYCCPATTIPGY